MRYDVIIIGAGPGGIFAAYELMKKKPECKIAVFEEGYPLEKRKCPIDGEKIKSCINCKRCSIMCGFGGAGAFSDGKYNITNDFGGTLFEYIGKKQAVELMKYVDSVKSTYMKQLLYSFFKDETFAKKFKCVSAAKTVHHGFAGGLLEHSLSVTRLCDKMSSNYDFLNRDLLITCAMLHDVGKVKELSEFPKNDYTDEGNFLGHIVIGYEMVMEKVKQIDGFPDMLAMQIGHCILSHHGELEYGSPKKPSIAEAVALSMADNMDAKLETLREALEAKDTNDWLGYNRWLDSNIRRTTNEV